MSTLYAMFVFIGVAEKCPPIYKQVDEHVEALLDEDRRTTRDSVAKLLAENDQISQEDEAAAPEHVANLANKNSWISFITALPALAGLVISFVITSDANQDNG